VGAKQMSNLMMSTDRLARRMPEFNISENARCGREYPSFSKSTLL
jgi:hypothetical protein